ncbi:MAG: aldose 1-epimerase family protein [Eubacteriales bacterium]|nr:aldose 1-epimerase family protein [Eubacteriales bacterium]
MELNLHRGGASAMVTTLGAEMRRYVSEDGTSRLWSGDAAVWSGVSPHLFPVIGNLKDGQVYFGGKPYATPKHGIARHSEFAVLRQSEDSCTLRLQNSPETEKVYPFAFAFDVTHQLAERGFTVTYEVENRSEADLPFTLGGHPAFTCPMKEGERFEDYIVRFAEPEEGTSLLVNQRGLIEGKETIELENGRELALRYEDFDQKDTLLFAGLKSRAVELVHRQTGHGLRFSFPAFSTLAVWSKPSAHAPYVCIEPWIGLPAFADEKPGFEHKPYHIEMKPGESYSAWYGMETI